MINRCIAICFFLLAGTACDNARPAVESEKQVRGTLTLIADADGIDLSDLEIGASCEGDGGYDDVNAAAQVTVRDQDDTVLAVGDLGQGSVTSGKIIDAEFGTVELTDRQKRSYASLVDDVHCEFPFDVSNVPTADVTFFSFEVASRGEIRYSVAEMRGMDWKVDLTLGG